MISSPLNSAWNFSSLMPITATTAFFRLPSFPTCTSRRSRFSPLASLFSFLTQNFGLGNFEKRNSFGAGGFPENDTRSEEHTSELQSRLHLVCRLLLEKKKKNKLTQQRSK